MRLSFLVVLLLLSPIARADLCADPTTGAWITCSSSTGTTSTGGALAFPSITAPSLPTLGGQLYVDSNGALHFQSQWYDATLPGGKYVGDATRSWFTTPIGFGNTATGSSNNKPNIRIQRGSTTTGASGALTLLDTLSNSLTAQETAVTFQVICPTSNASYVGKICVGLQVEADKNASGTGNPFAGNFVAKDLTGSQLSQVAIESDIVASNPDSSRVRVINDVICREAVVQTLGTTSCGDGVRARPSDNTGQTTGPTKIDHAFMAWTEASYPGASIGDAFGSDGGATNGLNLSSKAITATTLAQGTSGTATLTFDSSTIPAASPGAWISDGGEAFIPASTTISSVSTTAGVTTITMSANQTGNVALGQTITITQAFDTGELLSGKFNVAARSVTTQYGLEETLQNGLALGSPTGGPKGVGTLNLTGIYSNGRLYISSTAPTINAHFNTSGDSISAASTAAFQITVGSGTAGSTGSLTMPTATTGWSCSVTDVTTPASHNVVQTASSTTGVTVTDYSRTAGTAQNMVNGDKLNFVCGAF